MMICGVRHVLVFLFFFFFFLFVCFFIIIISAYNTCSSGEIRNNINVCFTETVLFRAMT